MEQETPTIAEGKMDRLREHLESTDDSYVKSRDVAGLTNNEAGQALRVAEGRGWVDKWKDTTHGNTWRNKM